MAAGLPDYFRGVDIAYQSLAQLMSRPTYGAAKAKRDDRATYANVATMILSVTGQGMIYGGIVYLDHTSSQKNSYVQISIDGFYHRAESFADMYKYGANKPNVMPFYLLKFDDTNFVYAVAVSPGLTFESGFNIYYVEQHGTTPNVTYNVIYALIT